MKIVSLAAAAALVMTSTVAFAQATNAPGASKVGGEPNPMKDSSSSMQPNSGSSATTGSSAPTSTKDASKSGAPSADNAERPGGPSNPTNNSMSK